MIVTFQYLRNFSGNVNWAVCFHGNEKKNSFGTKMIKIIRTNELKCRSCLNLHNDDWYNYTIKLLVVIPERFFMLTSKL